jgi:hypothetical protein
MAGAVGGDGKRRRAQQLRVGAIGCLGEGDDVLVARGRRPAEAVNHEIAAGSPPLGPQKTTQVTKSSLISRKRCGSPAGTKIASPAATGEMAPA